MLSSQLKLGLSYYSDLYDMIVPKDHILRKIRELVDFSFIYDELKNIHGYSRCDAAGLSNMQLQGAVSIFAVNLKRILKLKGEVCPNEEE